MSEESGEKTEEKNGQGKSDKKSDDSSETEQNDRAPEKKDDGHEEKREPFKWTPLKITGLALLIIIVVVVGIIFYIYESHHESTDDAYTAAYIHTIASRVAGTVIQVAVDDNEHVKRGQVLVRLDPRDYQVQLDKAQADFDRAKADFDRVELLKGNIAISQQDYDQTDTNMRDAKAELDDARDQLSYCTITAPAEGTVGNKTVQTGNRVVVGGALMDVVQSIWVVGNFKETQVGRMRVGQRVEITVDEIPDHTFYGWVESFSPGTGSSFALLPPDNATGNFTKIVQRVPVKILFDPDSIHNYEERLVPGLSVEANVDISSVPQKDNTPERREHNEPDRSQQQP
jgi:membrane fusion protein (multidrug efflux system)